MDIFIKLTILIVYIGAGNGTRTRDPQLGRLTLYQLSYSRLAKTLNSSNRDIFNR